MTEFPPPPEWSAPPPAWTPPPTPPTTPTPPPQGMQPPAAQPGDHATSPMWTHDPQGTTTPPPAWSPAPPAPAKHGHGKLIGSVAAVVVLAGGGAATYVAFAANDNGAGSPKAAVQKAIGDLEKSDLVGLLDDLAPGERSALTGPLKDNVQTYKRVGVLAPKADPKAVSGVTFKANDITFAQDTIKINDHVQIVKITGGTVDLSADIAKLPFTQRFLALTHATGSSKTQHENLAGKDIRIAAEKVGGHWYASLGYTIADEAVHHQVPTAADRVPAVGTDSPEAAVEKLVRAMMAGDYRSALALVSPDELGALHDYGGLALKTAPHSGADGVSLQTLDLATTPISGGAQRVTLKKLVLSMHGRTLTLAIDNSCAQLDFGPEHKKICASDAAELVQGFLGGIACSDGGFSSGGGMSGDGSSSSGGDGYCGKPPALSKAKQAAIADLFTGLTKIGVATEKSGGQWFVAPIRSYADLSATVLSGLHGDDLYQLIKLAD